MYLYISIGEIWSAIKDYNETTGHRAEFIDILKTISKEKTVYSELPLQPSTTELMKLNDQTFIHQVKNLYHRFPDYMLYDVERYDVVPTTRCLSVINSFWGVRTFIHRHDCFEINYIFSGSAKLHFLDEERDLRSGDLCMLSPFTEHDIVPDTSDTLIFTILVKEKYFQKTFMRLFDHDDIISLFFKKIFLNPEQPNYLLFNTEASTETKDYAKRLFLENFQYDRYMQQNSINLLELLFTSILRNDSAYYQFSSYESGPDYAPILRYIQSHYQTITLKLLTEKFNYAIPYLSKVIKDCTGKNFSQLVKEQRMREAIKRITETNESIEQIAYTVGYNSADHFARVFREFYNISPRQYRTKYRVNGEVDLF